MKYFRYMLEARHFTVLTDHYKLVTPDEQHDYVDFITYRDQEATGILRKLRHITLHRPISNRSESNAR